MGHGICETFNKQAALTNDHGQATGDSKDIGNLAWRLLESFDFDPKELRGIGIQIQRLEKADAAELAVQAKLSFQLALRPKTPECDPEPVGQPQVVVQPPSQEEIVLDENSPGGRVIPLDAPPFSQVDKEVFDALPEDIRREFEEEYKRRSKSPIPKEPSLPPAKRPKVLARGANLRRITQQLAPRNRSSISPKKSALFRGVAPLSMQVTEEELRQLDIDPEVFAILPVKIQREQLITARYLKNGGVLTEPKLIKDIKRKTREYPRKPPPQAKHPQHPFLKQQGPKKGEKLYFTQTEDVQRVIEVWVEGFQEDPPNQKDVEYFSKFLVQSVETSDTGMEKTIAVMKWWLVLLRRHWELYEHVDPPESQQSTQRVTSEMIGRAWWTAFREVKCKVDSTARKRFGGTICFR